jgi:hypothetical protein
MPKSVSKCKFLFLFSILCFATQLNAGVDKELPYPESGKELSADELADQVYYANHFYSFDNFSIKRRGRTMSVLINKTENGSPMITTVERHLNNNYDQGNAIQSRDLAIFHSGKLRGTGMLVTEYRDDDKSKDYIAWLPSVRKIRRFAQPNQEDAWGGSVFTFGDVLLRRPDDETHEIVGRKKMQTCLGTIVNIEDKLVRNTGRIPERSCRHLNKEVYGLKSTTNFNDWWYDYRISYVDTKSFADYRTLYYKDNTLIKIIDRDRGLVKSRDTSDPRALFWKYWYGLDLVTGKESLAIIPRKVVSFNTNLKNRFWTERTLRKIKR